MKRVISAILALCFFLLLTTAPARACRIPSGPFYVLSEDGSRVFHFSPDWWEQGDGRPELTPTGLYYNTDPLTPIYLLEDNRWAPREWELIFSRDMRYFAWIPYMNTHWNLSDSLALVFYADGVAQRTYKISDLVFNVDALHQGPMASPMTVQWVRPVSLPRFESVGNRDIVFNAEDKLLTIRAVESRTFVFDITTGEILASTQIESRQTEAVYTETISSLLPPLRIVGAVICIGGITFLFLKRRHRVV